MFQGVVMQNKSFMRALRLTTEPRFLTPFEQRLIRYHDRQQESFVPFMAGATIVLAVPLLHYPGDVSMLVWRRCANHISEKANNRRL